MWLKYCFHLFIVHASLAAFPEIYDFVVIGGGTAGSIVAARLSEVTHFNVLVLEAGGEPPSVSKIPSCAAFMYGTQYDWNYTSTPQKCLNDRVLHITRGKMLGGTGSMNSMNWLRGNKYDFETWGNNWKWNSNLKYFIESENDTEIDVDKKFHGSCGPICITNPGSSDQLIASYLNEIKKFGYKQRDLNDGEQLGYNFGPINVCNYERQSTYTNYLKPALIRKNLKVVKYALVEKIVFDKRKKAIAVSYVTNGQRTFAIVKKEVIVSAGTLNSPQVLMLSGIGPDQHLKSLNITLVNNLPVGNNLKDQICVAFMFTKKNSENVFTNETIEEFFIGKGPLTKFNYGNAFIVTNPSSDAQIADTQISLSGIVVPADRGGVYSYFLVPILLRPKSVGIVRLKSSNAVDKPIIDPKYLSFPEDIESLAKAAKFGYEIAKLINHSNVNYSLHEINAPKCSHFNKDAIEFWRCVARTKIYPTFHMTGTCKMGPKDSAESVVDEDLKVIGVKGVRVVDASIMPTIPSSNPQAVIAMIAEKASDLIIKNHNKFN